MRWGVRAYPSPRQRAPRAGRGHTPRIACQATKTTAFDATQHVRAEVYRGSNLVYEKISGTFSMHNDTALSMAEALVTLVLRPDDSDQALEYFRTYTDEELRLDELNMWQR